MIRTMTTIHDLPWWDTGIENLRALNRSHGEAARRRAAAYADTYRSQRAVMVFDMIASRQRRYERRVLPMVERFRQSRSSQSLQALAEHGLGEGHGLRTGEPETMQAVAAGLRL
jgi:hypothetical protein